MSAVVALPRRVQRLMALALAQFGVTPLPSSCNRRRRGRGDRDRGRGKSGGVGVEEKESNAGQAERLNKVGDDNIPSFRISIPSLRSSLALVAGT